MPGPCEVCLKMGEGTWIRISPSCSQKRGDLESPVFLPGVCPYCQKSDLLHVCAESGVHTRDERVKSHKQAQHRRHQVHHLFTKREEMTGVRKYAPFRCSEGSRKHRKMVRPQKVDWQCLHPLRSGSLFWKLLTSSFGVWRMGPKEAPSSSLMLSRWL